MLFRSLSWVNWTVDGVFEGTLEYGLGVGLTDSKVATDSILS